MPLQRRVPKLVLQTSIVKNTKVLILIHFNY
jgi:hypothetical protein